MTAKIFARTSDAALTEFWVNDDVIRVGSDADCELPLPGIAPHALTVQHRGGRYFVFNRSSAPIRIAGQIVPEGASNPWDLGQELEIGGEAALMLQSAEEALKQTPSTKRYDDDEEQSTDEPTEKTAGKNTTSLIILGACAVGILFLLTFGAKQSSAKSTTVQFEEVVEDYTWEHGANDPTARRVLDGVQRARIAELRKDFASAREKYGEAKDLLWTKKQSANGGLSDVDERMLSFITERLPRVQ